MAAQDQETDLEKSRNMNAPLTVHPQVVPTPNLPVHGVPERDDEANLQEYWDIIVDGRWMIAAITAVAIVLGVGYALLARPYYESNLLIQVEDSQTSAKSFLGEAASLFDVKTPATAEMEIIRSRMVIGRAVDATLMYVTAVPKRLPLIGDWLARGATELSEPGVFGFGGWVRGSERIVVKKFDVPTSLEERAITLRSDGEGNFSLMLPDSFGVLTGTVGKTLEMNVGGEPLTLLVDRLDGRRGAEFTLERRSRLKIVEDLQSNLKLAEKGRQSGVIDATLQDWDKERLVQVLNEIAQQYVRQNVERKAAEAQKTLAFLDIQLPQFKRQLDVSEEAYNRYRNQKGTVSLDEEARLILVQSVELQGKLLEAQQRRRDLVSRFTVEHPAVKTLDEQIAAFTREIGSLNARVKALPSVQQDAVRLERDVKVNNELYQQLKNNALQLQLIREGKIGNVRLIDSAVMPLEQVRPKKLLTIGLALLVGVIVGVIYTLARAAFFRGIRSPQEVEAQTGLSVYSTIPLSEAQVAVARRVAAKQKGVHILAEVAPSDVAVEALRSLRTALQFTMLDASNNIILITGGTPGVGKSFASSNFAAVMASAGKRILLIDADLRKGHLNQYFGLGREQGLSELISGAIGREQAIKKSVLPNLDFMPTGSYPPRPAELLVSSAFSNLLSTLSGLYDVVIIDSAPVLVTADTLSIATHVGTLLLVARAEQTFIGDLHESVRRLSHSGKTPTGVLFNALDLTRRHYGKYGYRYGAYNYSTYKYRYGVARGDSI